MLDKEVVQFTKNGMIQHDLATGEKKQLTLSDYGKQLRYENHESTYKHQSTAFTPSSHQKRFYLRASTRGEKHYGDSKDTIMNEDQTIPFRKAAIRPYLYKRAKNAQEKAVQSRSSENIPSFTDTLPPEHINSTQQYTIEQEQTGGYDVDQHLQVKDTSIYFADAASTQKIRSAKASVAAHILNKATRSAEAAAKAASANYDESSNPALHAGAAGLSAAQQAASVITPVKLSKSQKERLGAAALVRRKKASNSSVALSEETEQQAASSGKTALKAFGREIIASSSKKSVLSIICVIMLPLLVLLMISSAFGALSGSNASSVPLPAAVQNYRPIVSVYAAQFGMTDYVDLILAVMAQESGGEGLDPMQAAENTAYNKKYPAVQNGIQDPQYSIWCGVQELKEALRLASCTSPYDMEHIKLALQAYNYGTGFIIGATSPSWPGTHVWTQALADDFHNRGGGGDPQYIEHVLRYYSGIGGGLGYADVSFQNVKKVGESLLGTPYVLGGNSPGVAMDCSSFVCYVYTKAGKNMPRTTAQGIYDQYCTPVSPSEAKAGDLIFFKNTYDCGETITHVGIYCGNGVMLEEGGSHVQYANCSSSYWQSHFYAYGRVK
ncbi:MULTISPECIES: bifunctional lytic transglycosylase/C40 family peptidase [Caproicibacterium]|uniref:Bifunctional lytic transglycosylase/C40 family peptidase n=1 Tax=Caproicibacterium argilliputei TaxID=3030016 RepID=A0AA97D9T3_9FIRM|nr:bifunctional lytic transglycosylase/C40 family peptidase [Caproicibacterium argilliputei]WOC32884.1 bifunctional lytic transglycosylase/C40 family peptidase [Caproicibacterium argilliputei]